MPRQPVFSVRVTKKGTAKKYGYDLAKLPDKLQSTLTRNFGIQFSQLATQTVNKMAEVIEKSRKRPKDYSGPSNLVQALKGSIKISNMGKGGYKISFIDGSKLDRQAPYWKLLNYGGINPLKGLGLFGRFGDGAPAKGGSGSTFFQTNNSQDFMMFPKKPIEGIRYLNIGIGWLNLQWGKYTRKFKKTVNASFVDTMKAKRLFGIKSR